MANYVCMYVCIRTGVGHGEAVGVSKHSSCNGEIISNSLSNMSKGRLQECLECCGVSSPSAFLRARFSVLTNLFAYPLELEWKHTLSLHQF